MNTTTTHTPGPWAATDIGLVTARDGAESVVYMGQCLNAHDAERCAANARLIAAAPELLAALEVAERELRLAADGAMEDDRMASAVCLNEVAIYAAEVLAKARGE